jgi:hypothetical protein
VLDRFKGIVFRSRYEISSSLICNNAWLTCFKVVLSGMRINIRFTNNSNTDNALNKIELVFGVIIDGNKKKYNQEINLKTYAVVLLC